MAEPAILEYQKAPARRRRLWRRAALFLIVAAAAVTVYQLGGGWLHRGRLLFWQARCESYEAPPQSLVFATGSLPLSSGAEPGFSFVTDARAFYASRGRPPCWDAYLATRGPGMTTFFHNSSGYGLPAPPVLFLHRVRKQNGTERLLALYRHVTPWERDRFPGLFQYFTFQLKGASGSPPISIACDSTRPVGMLRQDLTSSRGRVLRFYAGQADPNDLSHFWIPYTLDDRPGIIDGWLKGYDPSEYVELRMREEVGQGP